MYRAVIIVAIAVSACSAIPSPEVFNCRRPCTREYRPICGSDDFSYPNECEFKIGRCRLPGLRAMRQGRCEEPDKGPPGYGVEHLNEALDSPSCGEDCPRTFDPVCASNRQTFSSLCDLEKHNCRHPDDQLVVLSSRSCPRESTSSVNRYEQARQDALSGRHGSRGGGFVACFRPCPRHFRPVCASNSVTYANRCVYNVANCRRQGALRIQSRARCVGSRRVAADPRNV